MICVDNRGYESSLEKRKLYEVLIDRVAGKHHQIRVIDESKKIICILKFLLLCGCLVLQKTS
jgi:hypothetical protein